MAKGKRKRKPARPAANAAGSPPAQRAEAQPGAPGEPAEPAGASEPASWLTVPALDAAAGDKDDKDDKEPSVPARLVSGARGGLASPWLAAGLVAFLAALVYAHSVAVPFLFDDAPVVTRNRLLWSWDAWWDLIWHQPDRALTNLTFLVNFQLAHLGHAPMQPYGIEDWWSYHVVSILLHAGNAALVFALVRELLRALRGEVPERAVHWVALGGAALWALHPAHTMAVAYIAQRYALMAAAAFMGALVLYLRLRRRMDERGGEWVSAALAEWPLLLGALAAATACAVTKPNAVVIPAAILGVELVVFRARRLPLALAFFAPFVLGGLVALVAYGGDGVMARFFPAECPTSDRLEYLITQVAVVPRYLHLFLFPYDLCVEQSFPVLYDSAAGSFTTPDAPLRLALGALAHGLLLALAGLLAWRGLRLVPLAIGWFYLTNVVESSVIPILDPMVDHRMYLPTVLFGAAFLGALARAWPSLVRRAPWAREAVPLGVVALVLTLACGTVLRVVVWTSATGIWEDTIAKRPHCARAYSSLGMEHLYAGDWLAAVGPIETALELGPYHVEGWNNLGKAYLELGRWKQAEQALLRGIEVNEVVYSPSIPLCWNNLGLVYMKMAQEAPNAPAARALLEKAVFRLERAVRLDPAYEVAYLNLANGAYALMRDSVGETQTRYARAVADAVAGAERVALRRGGSLSIDSERRRIKAQALLGEAEAAFERVEAYLEQGLRADLQAALLNDLAEAALVAHERGDPAAPALCARAAEGLDRLVASLEQDVPALEFRRAQLAEALGQVDDAARRYQQALDRFPQDPQAAGARERLQALQQRATVPGPQ